MAQIKNETEYRKALSRIDELLPIVNDDTPTDDQNYVELDLLSQLVDEYEEIHYPIGTPTLAETLRELMYEQGLTQATLAHEVGVSPSRVSEYLSGKSEPTLKVAKRLYQKMKVPAQVLLGA